MKCKISLVVLVLHLSFFGNSLLYSQNKNEIPLLLNTEPVLAVVNDSAELVRVVKKLPGYMDGYQLETQSYKYSDVVAARGTSSTGYLIISSESYSVNFSDGFAVLDDSAIAVLDNLIAELKNSPEKSLLLSVYDDYMSTSLYKNRINAIKSYVKIEGISLDRIKLNYLEGSATQDEIKINFVE